MIIRHEQTTEKTWAEIQAAAADGTLLSGDRIAVELKTGEIVDFIIAHDADDNCYFVTRDCLNEPRAMNTTDTNEGGWPEMDLRAKLNSVIFGTLPDELQAIIAETQITQIVDEAQVTCNDKLFCLSYTQVYGDDWTDLNDMEPDDSQLDIFASGDARLKKCGERDGFWWWLRLPYPNTKRFVYVSGIGDTVCIGASSKGGVVFGFRLMPPES